MMEYCSIGGRGSWAVLESGNDSVDYSFPGMETGSPSLDPTSVTAGVKAGHHGC